MPISAAVASVASVVERQFAGRLIQQNAWPAAAFPFSSTSDTWLIDGFQRKIESCNNAACMRPPFRRFVVGGKAVGFLQPWFAEALGAYSGTFQRLASGDVQLRPTLKTIGDRTAAVAEVLRELRREGVVQGWRDELYPVVDRFSSEPALLVERAAAAMFGIKAYGVQVNGYTDVESATSDGGIRRELWVGKRSSGKAAWPGMLDHLAAGGLGHGLSPQDTVIAECAEEASIPASLARRAISTGAVSYEGIHDGCLKRDVLFTYDLAVPPDFVPVPRDGEAEHFQRWPVEEVMKVVAQTDRHKPNCNLVLIDFFIRHGYIRPEHDGFLQLVASLRRGDCS